MRPVRLLAVLCLLLLAALVSPAPASAAVRDIRITQDGVSPQQLQVSAGDEVRFVNDDSFVHRVVDDGGPWDFEDTLLPGETFTTDPLTTAGTYAYRGAGLDSFTGTVVVQGSAGPAPRPTTESRPTTAPPPVPVPAPTASPAPARTPDADAAPAPSSSSSPSAAAPAPVFTGGSGRVQGPPPLAGGTFGGFEGLAPPASAVPDPQVAPGLELGGQVPLPQATTEAGPPPVLAAEDSGEAPAPIGALPGLGTPVEARRFGLPLVLATVLAGGVLSLLVRLLLAEAPGGPADAATA